MARVYVPAAMRELTDGAECVSADGRTVRQVIESLEQRYPGVRERLCRENQLRPGLAVSVDGAISGQGLLQSVGPESEVHFLPALGGG